MSDPIPANIYAAIKDWVSWSKTGQISLNVHEGKILNAELIIKERILAKF